jgi:hypothetical protein
MVMRRLAHPDSLPFTTGLKERNCFPCACYEASLARYRRNSTNSLRGRGLLL